MSKFHKRTDFDLVEVVPRLDDPKKNAKYFAGDARAFIQNVLSLFDEKFLEGDLRRDRWQNCCNELTAIVSELGKRHSSGTSLLSVLRYVIGAYENVEREMLRIIRQLDDKDQREWWRDEMSVVFRMLVYAAISLEREKN